MKKTLIYSLILLCSVQFGFAQELNLPEYGQLDLGLGKVSGSWGYTASDGTEYALVGARQGLVVVDISTPTFQVIDTILGPNSNWREITAIGDYAYVTTEGSGTGEGMQVIDLTYLPDSVHLLTTYDETFQRGHIIGRDIYSNTPMVYVMGTQTDKGVHFIDVSDPANPVDVGGYHPYYIHDAHIRGNIMYAAAIYDGKTDIVDISDLSNPVLLGSIDSPFPHSIWTSQDNKNIIITDEIDGLPANIYNIENPADPIFLAKFTSNDSTLVHNPYIKGDFAYMSHNSEGIRIYDIGRIDVPVEVAYHDTYFNLSGGFNGLWSAWPFFPNSNKVLGGNREDGLHVWDYSSPVEAGYVYGIVKDAVTLNPISNALIKINPSINQTNSAVDGTFKTGNYPSTLEIVCSANGYNSETVTEVNLNSNDSLFFEIFLNPWAVNTDLVNDLKNNISVYSGNDVLTINYKNLDVKNYQAQLYNTSGQLIDSFEFIGKEQGSYTYNSAALANGIYFLEIEKYNQKIIINH